MGMSVIHNMVVLNIIVSNAAVCYVFIDLWFKPIVYK